MRTSCWLFLSCPTFTSSTGWSRRRRSRRSCGRRRSKTGWPASASRASTWLECTITEPPSLPQPPRPPWPPPRHPADTPPPNLILEAPRAIWSAWGWWHWYVLHVDLLCCNHTTSHRRYIFIPGRLTAIGYIDRATISLTVVVRVFL